MKCVEFFIQNEGKDYLDCVKRNWNIRNIMSLIMTLNPQVGNGVISYYFRMVDGNKDVTVFNDAIRINEEIQTKGEAYLDDSNTADELFELLMDTQYEDYCGATICVTHDNNGENLIRFVCDEIAVNEFNPTVADEVIQSQWDRDLQDTRKYPFLICSGPNAGRYIRMTNAEAQSGRMF